MKLHEIEIDGQQFSLNPLPFEKNQEQLVDLVELIGPALGQVVAALKDHDGDAMAMDVMAFAPVVPLLAAKLRGGALTKIMKTFLQSARVDGQELLKVWDMAFAGRIDVAWRLFAFALKVNYGRLFTGLRAPTPSATETQPGGEGSTSPVI